MKKLIVLVLGVLFLSSCATMQKAPRDIEDMVLLLSANSVSMEQGSITAAVYIANLSAAQHSLQEVIENALGDLKYLSYKNQILDEVTKMLGITSDRVSGKITMDMFKIQLEADRNALEAIRVDSSNEEEKWY